MIGILAGILYLALAVVLTTNLIAQAGYVHDFMRGNFVDDVDRKQKRDTLIFCIVAFCVGEYVMVWMGGGYFQCMGRISANIFATYVAFNPTRVANFIIDMVSLIVSEYLSL